MVNKVKQVLKDCFHSAAAMQVVELEVGQKYMVTETFGSTLNINLNQQQTQPTTQNLTSTETHAYSTSSS